MTFVLGLMAGVLFTLGLLGLWANRRSSRQVEEQGDMPTRVPPTDITREAVSRARVNRGVAGEVPRPRNSAAYQAAVDAEIESKLGPVIGSDRHTTLHFDYADTQGEITTRKVTDWVEHSRHIRGFCHLRQSERTFAKVGIIEWHDGTGQLLQEDG
jgi:hypothetical protein